MNKEYQDIMNYENCRLCPRKCSINRYETIGSCQCKTTLRAARAGLHLWEEPCISGINGSGTVFFSGCTLKCCYCQNYKISAENYGKDLTICQLSDIFLRLQDQGAHNISLITATQFLPSIIKALDQAKPRLFIPVIYNCGGFERTETLTALHDYVDIFLPDLKYMDNQLAQAYSRVDNYFDTASKAIQHMVSLAGPPEFYTLTPSECGAPYDYGGSESSCRLMKKGVIIRHMVLPGHKEDSIALLHWMAENLPARQYYISLLSQYTPYRYNEEYPDLNRRITTYEYEKVVNEAIMLGLTQGFMQKKSSAKEEYTPPFDLEGLE